MLSGKISIVCKSFNCNALLHKVTVTLNVTSYFFKLVTCNCYKLLFCQVTIIVMSYFCKVTCPPLASSNVNFCSMIICGISFSPIDYVLVMRFGIPYQMVPRFSPKTRKCFLFRLIFFFLFV